MENQHAEQAGAGWSGRGKLSDLVAELERQKSTRYDFVADTRDLRVQAEGGKLILAPGSSRAGEWLGKGTGIRQVALEQIGEKSEPDVPRKFLNAMAEQRPAILADLLDKLLQAGPARRFIRCLDGQVRAFLSDKYRVLDNYDVAYAALDAVRAAGGEVVEASLSDKNMRIKFTTRQVWDTINVSQKMGEQHRWFYGSGGNQKHLGSLDFRRGDNLPGGLGTIHPLVTISNSETGHGGFSLQLGMIAAWCTNMAIIENVVGRVHLGEKLSVGIFSDATLNQESKAIYMKARDAVSAAFKPEVFKKIVAVAQAAQLDVVTAPQAAVENVAKAASLSDISKDTLLGYFIKDYDMTRYGLAQAAARLAQDDNDGERAADLEALAGKIMKGDLALAGGKK